MYVVDVIPITRGPLKEQLSYFCSRTIDPGSLVTIPLRGRSVQAIVLTSESVQHAKAAVRGASFELRKIDARTARAGFSSAFMRAVEATARYHATSIGLTLYHLVPQAILSDIQLSASAKNQPTTSNLVSERLILQADRTDRFGDYRALIRESFARNASVFVCVPTVADAEYSYRELTRGISEYAFLFHSILTKKTLRTHWEDALKATHPILIVGTGQFLSLPRADMETIIIEREHAKSFRGVVRPHLDMRVFAEYYTSFARMRFVLGDLPLRTETLWRFRNGELDELRPLKHRTGSKSPASIIDMRGSGANEQSEFRILSPELTNILTTNVARGTQAFLFVARRGLAPITLCNDCGTAVACNACGAPVVLHQTLTGNQYLCHSCGAKRSAEDVCAHCGSWRLTPLGIGIQRVRQELTNYPGKVFTLDRETVKSHKEAVALADEFCATKGSVLIGTPMALPYLTRELAYTAVVSVDSLLSLPEWRAHERVLDLLFKMRALATEEFLIQTRMHGEKLLEYVVNGNVTDFYKDEIAAREQFGYPPFTVLIRLTAQGEKQAVATLMRTLSERFAEERLHVYAPTVQPGGTSFMLHGLMKIPRAEWPNAALARKLRELPPHIAVQVDPESLL